MTSEEFQSIRKDLPEQAGIYRYYDKAGNILYIGKAIDIRKRVSSYFLKSEHSLRLQKLVKQIHRIEFTVVHTEQDAFLLENSLIKEFQPRYNILLKDDKTYPYICIRKEPFPRIMLTRQRENDGSEYLGPYTSVHSVKNILSLLFSIFPIRSCSLNLEDEKIMQKKFKVCLEYHIKRCAGPCEGLQSEEEYMEGVQQIRNILKSDYGAVVAYLRKKMDELATNLEFEKAAEFKEKLNLVSHYQSKNTVANPRLGNFLVLGMASDNQVSFIHVFKVLGGTIVSTRSLMIQNHLDESPSEILVQAVQMIRDEDADSHELTVLLPFELSTDFTLSDQQIPLIGDKKKLVDMAQLNARLAQENYLKKKSALEGKSSEKRILEQLQADLRMKDLPTHIECFDNSNIMGTHPVSAMVVFKNGKASKADYRHYNVQTVEGPDDFSTMREVIRRRYTRVQEENTDLPKLIIVDGGKGQLSSAVSELKALGLYGKVPIIGIAKKLEEIYYPDDPIPLHISKKSESLKLIQRIRDEAHRFGITHHRQRRDKSMIQSELDAVAGLGETTKEKLLNHYKSVKKIRQAPFEELAGLIGPSRAKKLREFLSSSD